MRLGLAAQEEDWAQLLWGLQQRDLVDLATAGDLLSAMPAHAATVKPLRTSAGAK